MVNTILIMQGGPATGKTTLGKQIAAALRIPYLSKDGVKEPIFDHVGFPTAWETYEPLSGKKMDDAAKAILFYLVRAQLEAGRNCLINSTFNAANTPALLDIQSQYPFTPIQILCRTDPDELERRYLQRAETQVRHPGHLDKMKSDAFDARELERINQPLDIGGHILTADTTDFTDENFLELMQSIQQMLE